jgi:hypothetical protein
LVLVLLKYGGGGSCQNASYGKEPQPQSDLLVKLLTLAMAGGCEVMETEIIRFGGHVYLFGLFVGGLVHA